MVEQSHNVVVMMVGCCAEACTAAVLIGVVRLPGCPFGSAWCLVCEVCRLGRLGLVVGVSCLLCSSAMPGVWSFLRVTHRCCKTTGCVCDSLRSYRNLWQ